MVISHTNITRVFLMVFIMGIINFHMIRTSESTKQDEFTTNTSIPIFQYEATSSDTKNDCNQDDKRMIRSDNIRIDHRGDILTENVTRVIVGDRINLKLHQSDYRSLYIRAQCDIQRLVLTQVEGNTLSIGMHANAKGFSPYIHLALPRLAYVGSRDNSTVYVTEPMVCDDLTLECSNSGVITADEISAKKISLVNITGMLQTDRKRGADVKLSNARLQFLRTKPKKRTFASLPEKS